MSSFRRENHRGVYLDYLYALMNVEDDNEVITIFKELYNIDYLFDIPNDDNRCTEGIEVRLKFIEDWRDTHDGELLWFVDKPCSVLEMMIGLAFRWDNYIYDAEVGSRATEFLLIMFSNLGLLSGPPTDDYVFESNLCVFEKIEIMLEHTYEKNGRGGLFPLRVNKNNVDQRNLELWYQLQNYIEENYIR